MSKIIKTSLLTTLVLVSSLYLVACGKDEKAKPETEKSTPAQVTQPVTKSEAMTKSQALEISQPAASETSSANTATAPEALTESKSAPVTQKISRDYEKMLNLARKSGCLACHNVDKKIVGPAWKDVAARYISKTNARALLIEKISKGGRGGWTDVVGNVAMPPYFPRVSKENIGSLVDFILSL